MSDGTLFTDLKERRLIRTIVPRGLVRSLKLDVKLADPSDAQKLYDREFPWGKYPTFVGPRDEWTLTEAMAIDYYLIHLSSDEKVITQLLGPERDFRAHADILRWESLSTSDFLNEVCEVFFPLVGVKPYNAAEFKAAKRNIDTIVSLYERRLKEQQFLTSDDHETLADLISAAAFSLGFISFFDETWRSTHPEITNWFNKVIKSRFFEGEFENFEMCEIAMQPKG
ncbi:AIS_HP2_G0020710.mRNA.1.CDS.1 [Saccharomyces cerevisiae]|nr:AIS_HP2_G0020710.mRNA.1.CDS.1 [Saccharomyces cerevisiae]CAI6530064.1 AIS_HP2_G0020710.mRNA.1.CDS.1 [Saccharomyces cerevisiae]